MGERLFRFLVGDALAINMVCHFMNQNVVQVEPAKMVECVAVGQIEWMGKKENTGIPINAVTSQAAGPRFLLLARSGQQEDRAQTLA